MSNERSSDTSSMESSVEFNSSHSSENLSSQSSQALSIEQYESSSSTPNSYEDNTPLRSSTSYQKSSSIQISSSSQLENEICNDMKDNDKNGFFDCADPSCYDSPACASSTEANYWNCTDDIDNDFDQLIDCDDPQCSDLFVCIDHTQNQLLADSIDQILLTIAHITPDSTKLDTSFSTYFNSTYRAQTYSTVYIKDSVDAVQWSGRTWLPSPTRGYYSFNHGSIKQYKGLVDSTLNEQYLESSQNYSYGKLDGDHVKYDSGDTLYYITYKNGYIVNSTTYDDFLKGYLTLDHMGESTPGQCLDGTDNDSDGLVDCCAPGCAALQYCYPGCF